MTEIKQRENDRGLSMATSVSLSHLYAYAHTIPEPPLPSQKKEWKGAICTTVQLPDVFCELRISYAPACSE